MEGDLSARSFTLIFSVPIAQANFSSSGGNGVDLSVASRVADDQQVGLELLLLYEELPKHIRGMKSGV
jgi:hypothetical protein